MDLCQAGARLYAQESEDAKKYRMNPYFEQSTDKAFNEDLSSAIEMTSLTNTMAHNGRSYTLVSTSNDRECGDERFTKVRNGCILHGYGMGFRRMCRLHRSSMRICRNIYWCRLKGAMVTHTCLLKTSKELLSTTSWIGPYMSA